MNIVRFQTKLYVSIIKMELSKVKKKANMSYILNQIFNIKGPVSVKNLKMSK